MIECVFTIDYEIYGNGEGSLDDLVFAPTERLRRLFEAAGKRFVVFVEASELEIIERQGADDAIVSVRRQIADLRRAGFEIGLHLHPQWYNARRENGSWVLDYSEYNLCKLPRERVAAIVDQSIQYLRGLVDDESFVPLSFRAGNWLFQPSATVAAVIADRGIKIDSSVFKGGLQRQHGLDYRRAARNGYYWRFSTHVDQVDPDGRLLEIPTYTRMVAPWKMVTGKRVTLSKKGPSTGRAMGDRIARFLDKVRFRYPLKLDFCRMTLKELKASIESVVKQDRKHPLQYRPVVAIGHTKDLVDYETIQSFLSYLDAESIKVVTFDHVYRNCADSSIEGAVPTI